MQICAQAPSPCTSERPSVMAVSAALFPLIIGRYRCHESTSGGGVQPPQARCLRMLKMVDSCCQRSPIERYDAVRTRRTVPRREAEDGQFSPSEIAPSNGMSQSAPADGTETRDRLHSANGANTRSYRLRRRRTLGCKAARTGLMMYPRLHDTDAIDAQGCGSNRGKLIPREGLRSQLLF